MSDNNNTSGMGQSRKTRRNLQKRDAEILRNMDGGYVWKVIKEGVGNKARNVSCMGEGHKGHKAV